MSINHFLNKIKEKSVIDVNTFTCLCIIVLVGLGSFGLGRISVIKNESDSGILIKDESINIKKIDEINNKKVEGKTELNLQNMKEKKYIASKNGKLYYSIGCSGAKRIKPANEVWFATNYDAEKSGYILASSCK